MTLERRHETAWRGLIAALRVIEALCLREIAGEDVTTLNLAAYDNLILRRAQWLYWARAHRRETAQAWLAEDD